MTNSSSAALAMLIGVTICVTEARADDVNGAAKAFSQAQQAMLANDYARAAEMYELADELAPSAPALRNAARARRAAGHSATAATLAAQILQRYSNDKESRGVAEAILSELAPKLTQVEVACSEPCTLSIDGKAASSTRPNLSHVLYAQPGARTIAAGLSVAGVGAGAVSTGAGLGGAASSTRLVPPAIAEICAFASRSPSNAAAIVRAPG